RKVRIGYCPVSIVFLTVVLILLIPLVGLLRAVTVHLGAVWAVAPGRHLHNLVPGIVECEYLPAQPTMNLGHEVRVWPASQTPIRCVDQPHPPACRCYVHHALRAPSRRYCCRRSFASAGRLAVPSFDSYGDATSQSPELCVVL